MTERFSPEYIAFILSDEASVLQGQWKQPKEGDWILTEDSELSGYGALLPPLVTCLKEGGEGELITSVAISYGRSTDYVDETVTYGAMPDEIKKRCTWLPTLTDLLGMIEEAGYRFTKLAKYGGKYTHSAIAYGHRSKGAEGAKANGWKLTAAKLAVRVLGEGKE